MSFLTKNGRLAGKLATVASVLAILGVSPAYAFTQSDLVSGGSVWLETTIAVALVFVTAMAFSLQIARGYFIRNLEKFTLRLGADIWWLGYIMIRDALIFMSFIMGLMVFFPGTFLDYPIAVPFMPAAVVLFGVALVTKLYFDADENRNAFRAVTLLVFGGTLLWIFGVVFITETPLALSTLPAGVSGSSGMWYSIYNTFSSTSNLGLAMQSFYACFAALGVVGIFGFAHPILHSRIGGKRLSSASNQGPVAPSSIPARSVPSRAAETGVRRFASAQDTLQASTLSHRDQVDYIQ
jgi:hypothetical protein